MEIDKKTGQVTQMVGRVEGARLPVMVWFENGRSR
jgi:hypothetical protein